MSRSAQRRVASGIVTTILVALSFALLASYRGAGPVSADKDSRSPGDSGSSKDLADIDAMLEAVDIAAAATSYIELMESNPSALTQAFEERIQAVEGSIADGGISSAELTGLLDALPSISSADNGAGAYATLRLRETVLSELAQRDANTVPAWRAAVAEEALASLWEFQTDPYAYLLAAKAVQLSEEAGAEQTVALVQEFEDYLATAGTNMAAFAVRARMMERYESLENWTARNGSAQGLAADGDAQFLQDALASEAVPPDLKAGAIRALASAQLLIGDTESALSTLDSADELDPAVGAESVPPAALLNAPEEALSTKSTVSPNSKAAPSMPEHLPLAEQIGILDTQNPVLRFRMREPGMELPGDPALAADQRIVEVFPHPVFYPDEDDGGRLKPINIELSEGTQSDGSTAWEEERNTLKYRGDSRGRQFYRVGEYRLRMAPLFAGSENAASSALRQRLASQPSAVTRSGGGGLAAEGILGDGVVFLHDAAPGHVKEFVTLPSQPALPSAAAHWLLAYRWEAEGLAPEISGDEVVWKNSSGETIFRLPPPVAWDANGDPLAVSYRLRGNVVGLVVPAEALRGAAYPVVLDPTVTTGSSDISANLSPWYKISGMHAHKGMYARFALPDLTGFTSITQATFNAKIFDTLGSSVATAAYCEVESAWTESSGHAVLDAFSFSGATVTQSVTATSGWVSWDILGTTSTTGIAHIYAGDASPDPATVKIAATAYTNAPTGKTNGLALAYYDGGIYREFYGRTASSGNVPYIQIVYSQATPPTANFSADVTAGGAPLEVAFTDTSNGNGSTITAWSWNFGDANTSTSQSPTHEYTTPGTYTVSLTVTTASGSDGETKTNYIDVDDVTPPAITLLGDNPVDTPLGGTYTDAGATALDAHEGNLTAEIVVGGDPVDSETLGEYVITYDVSDSANNNAEQVTRTVNVVDMTPPLITLLGGNPLDIHLGGTYTDPGATASDNVDGDLTSSITVGGDTVDVETAGVYSVTYNVTDGAGNAAEEEVREVSIWPSLEIEVVGTGSTSPLPAQTHFFAPGSTVELYGFADNVDHIFDEWTGDAVADSDSAVTTILMDGPKSVTANFVEGHSVVTGVASGLGAIEAVPNKPIYPDGAEVAFTATPEIGYEFDHWVTDGTLVSGTVNDPAITLELSADANLVAHFNQLSYTLSVSTTGEGDVSPASASYHYGDPLSLTATPDSGWHFAYWTGGLDGTDNVKNLTVTGNITATAVFVEDFTLTVNTQGEGGVSPGGGTYIPGDPVSLTTTAGSGWRFDHWEGDFDSQANPLNFPMQDDYTVMAVFVEDPYLTVSTIGEGTVALSPTQPPEGYAPSTNVTLTAMPASGWLFEGWSGALSGNDNSESVTTPAASEIVAEFRQATTLTITKTGSGTGTVQVSDAMRTYSANPNGTYTVPMGAELTLTPSATSGCFYRWSGDVTGSYSPGMLTVTGNHAITAEFGMKSTLELTVIGEGSITLDPPQPPGGYCPGTEIQVTAVPDTDWVFNKWGGALPNLEWAPSQTLVTTPGPSEIVAYLAERPGIGGLNLLEDLGAYLVAIGEYTDPEEVDGFDYDFGEEDLEELETVYTPNGIPDAAEMVALQAVLENPSIEVEDGGVSHMAVWKIYLANLAQAEADLSTQSEAIQRAVATYMTLGTIGHQGKIADDVQTHFGATLDFSLYRNAGGRWFGANKDMDQDGVTNKSEWEYAVAEAAAPGYLSVAGGFFANSVSNDGEGGGESPYALPPNGSPDDFENSCTRRVALSVRNVDNVHHNLTVTARVVTPDGDQCVVVGEGQTKSFPIGTEVHVQASDASWFSGWYASGTLLSGSRNAKDSFTLTTSTEVIAYVKGTYQLEYVYNPYTRVEVSVAGGDDPLVLGHSEGYIGNRSIHYRAGTHLKLNAVSTLSGDEWLKVYSDYGNPAINQKSTATIDPDGATFVEVLSGSALYGYGEFKIEMSNGYGTVDFGTTSRPNFLDSVAYALPNPETAPWYKTTHPDAYPDPGYYPRSFDTANVTNSSPNVTASVDIRPTSQLTMKPAECLKNCTANIHGVTTFLNARHDYYGPTMHIDNAELVGIASAPDEFHKFVGFKVSSGVSVYKWSGGGAPDDFFDLDGFDEAEEENGLYAYDPIYIEMSQDVSVTPIYSLSTPKSHIFQPSEMCHSNSPWGPMHIATGCNGDSITLECDGDYFYRKGEAEIGHCIYWGGQNWFGFEYIESGGGDLLWAGMQITQDAPCKRHIDLSFDSGTQYFIDYTPYYVAFYPESESFSIPPPPEDPEWHFMETCFLSLYDVGYLDPEDRSAWQ